MFLDRKKQEVKELESNGSVELISLFDTEEEAKEVYAQKTGVFTGYLDEEPERAYSTPYRVYKVTK